MRNILSNPVVGMIFFVPGFLFLLRKALMRSRLWSQDVSRQVHRPVPRTHPRGANEDRLGRELRSVHEPSLR
jgi:hypothetical protein